MLTYLLVSGILTRKDYGLEKNSIYKYTTRGREREREKSFQIPGWVFISNKIILSNLCWLLAIDSPGTLVAEWIQKLNAVVSDINIYPGIILR